MGGTRALSGRNDRGESSSPVSLSSYSVALGEARAFQRPRGTVPALGKSSGKMPTCFPGAPRFASLPSFVSRRSPASNVLPQLPNASSGPGSKAASRNPQHSPLSPWPRPAPAELNVVCLGTRAPSSPIESQKRESRDYFQVNLGETWDRSRRKS